MSGLEHGVNLEIMQSAQALNSAMPGYVIEKLSKHFDGNLEGKKVVVLGTAFKAGTSDVRKSPGVALANILHKAGASVSTYDPQANDEAGEDLHPGITQYDSIESALNLADAIIVATE